MVECVAYFILGYNLKTKEYKKLYRCKDEKVFRYLEPTKSSIDIVDGYYDIKNNVIILNERYGA